MNIKKRIREQFDSLPFPSADKVLPKTALVEKQPKSYKKLTLRLAVAVLCIGVIITSVLLVLDKSPETSPSVNLPQDLSQNESLIHNAEDEDKNNSMQIGESVTPMNPDCKEPDILEPPTDVITIYTSKSEGETVGEFAGDMYRPDGYDEKIGSVLAIMMSMNEDADAKFNVLVHTYDRISLKALLSDKFGSVEVTTVEISGVFEGTACYVRLTDAQIKELAGYGLKCYYIGSGLGDYKDMNWETEEGIRTYCEIWGDMYTFNNRDILSRSDIYVED